MSGGFGAILSALRRLQDASSLLFVRPRRPPRALQEPFKRLSAAITQLSSNPKPFLINFDLQRAAPGPQKPLKSIEKQWFLKKSRFELESPLGLDVGPPLASLLGAFWPPRWLKPVLEFLLDRPRAVQEHFFPAPEPSRNAPRAIRKPLETPPEPAKPFQRLQEASKRPPGPIWHTFWNHSGAISKLCWLDVWSCSSRWPRTLDPRSQARRNVRERLNSVKVIVMFDVGGSMDPYVKLCEELFSAIKTEFKNLEYFYFHNCIYESVWKDNRRRSQERFLVQDIINKFSSDYKIIVVGDATMAPYEITNAGGSIEHWNEEAGHVWIKRLADHFDNMAWLNPVPDDHWDYTSSICIIKDLFEDRMYPLTLKGLEDGMGELSK